MPEQTEQQDGGAAPVHYRIFQPLEVKRERKKGQGTTVKLLVNDACAEALMDIMMTDNAKQLGACITIAPHGTPLPVKTAAKAVEDALQNMLDTWPNTEKQPGWVKLWAAAQEQARTALLEARKGAR